jgi:apolipoprotein N-acyltransferase
MVAMPSDGETIATVNQRFANVLGRVLDGQEVAQAERVPLTEALTANVDRLLARSAQQAEAGAQVVYWAEGNGVILAEQEAETLAKGQALADSHDLYLGMSLAVLRPGEEKTLENKIVLVDPDGQIVNSYVKAFPVPGGELEASVQGDAAMPVVETPLGRLGHVICFDMDHHSYIRQAGEQGVDVLFAPANDWAEVADLHADMAVFRAIENGAALVRPTSQGHTIAADPYGRLLGHSDFWATQGGALTVSVPTQGVTTVYTRIGDAFVGLTALALVILLGWAAVAGRRRMRRASLVPAAAD